MFRKSLSMCLIIWVYLEDSHAFSIYGNIFPKFKPEAQFRPISFILFMLSFFTQVFSTNLPWDFFWFVSVWQTALLDLATFYSISQPLVVWVKGFWILFKRPSSWYDVFLSILSWCSQIFLDFFCKTNILGSLKVTT